MAKKLGFTGIIFLILYSVITWSVIADHGWIQRFDYALWNLIRTRFRRGGLCIRSDWHCRVPVVFILTLAVVLTLLTKRMHIAAGLTIYIFASFLWIRESGHRPRTAGSVCHNNGIFNELPAAIQSYYALRFVVILILLLNKLWQKISPESAGFIILFVMTSRIYLGVHAVGYNRRFTFGMTGYLSVSLYQLPS